MVLALHCHARPSNANDSLLNVLKQSKQDTLKAHVLIQLCRNTLDRDNKAMEGYARELLELSQQLKFHRGLADAHNFLGIVEDEKNNYAKALELYGTALEYAKVPGLEKKKASIDNNIGLIYWKIGDHQKALGYYYDALRVFEQLEEKKLQANVLSNIGLIESSLKDQEKALQFFRKAQALRKEINDEYGLASTYNNIAKSLTLVHQEDSSRYYTRLAIELQQKSGDEYGLAISLGNMGTSFGAEKKFDSAFYYLNKCAELREKTGDQLGLTFVYHAMAENYKVQKDLRKAATYVDRALALANEINSRERIGTISETAGYIYAQLGDYRKAYYHMDKHAGYLADIFDTVKNEQAAELAVKYEVEKKDLRIAKDKAELAGKQAQIENQELKLAQRNTLLGLLALALVGGSVLAYLFYNRSKLRDAARLQQEIIRQQDIASRAILEAEERERKRIAGDLHDGLGQLCSAIKMNLSGIESQIGFADKETALTYEKTLALTDQACRDVRTISHQMMPNVLLKSGLASAVKDFLDKIDARALQVHLNTFGLQERLDSNVETVLYRVIQETVNNVIKHARANKLYIQLGKDEEGITATIEDNGTGFDVSETEQQSGIGLKNIASRVGYLKGTVEFDSAPGRGTVVNVWIPDAARQ